MADPIYRIMDRGKGPFCKTDKQGNAAPFPPRSLEPIRNKQNPRATRHINKTAQDHMPVNDRPRVIEAHKRAERMKAS